jgi:hypothetical protein
MQPLRDILDSSQFTTGFGLGVCALVVALAVVLGLSTLSRSRRRPPGLVGPAFTIAVVLALGAVLGGDEVWDVPTKVVAGLVALWLAGMIAGWTPAPWLVGPILAIPGAWMLADSNQGLDETWVVALIAAGTVVIGATTANFDRRTSRLALGPLLLFATVGGIYLTVPDTEIMRCVVGVSLPLVLLAWPFAAACLGAGGSYAAVGLLLWIAPIEGIGRAGSVVGALGAFALLAGEPIGHAIFRAVESRTSRPRFQPRYPRALVVGAQVVLVLYASRVAGAATHSTPAMLLLLPMFLLAIGFGLFVEIPELRLDEDDEDEESGGTYGFQARAAP